MLNQEAEGATQELADRMGDTLQGSIKRAQAAVEGLFLAIGERASDGLRGVLMRVTDLAGTLAENVDTVI